MGTDKNRIDTSEVEKDFSRRYTDSRGERYDIDTIKASIVVFGASVAGLVTWIQSSMGSNASVAQSTMRIYLAMALLTVAVGLAMTLVLVIIRDAGNEAARKSEDAHVRGLRAHAQTLEGKRVGAELSRKLEERQERLDGLVVSRGLAMDRWDRRWQIVLRINVTMLFLAIAIVSLGVFRSINDQPINGQAPDVKTTCSGEVTAEM